MDPSKSLDEKIKIDNNLSNRYIDLDPNGYFIIKVDFEENKIITFHISVLNIIIYILIKNILLNQYFHHL